MLDWFLSSRSPSLPSPHLSWFLLWHQRCPVARYLSTYGRPAGNSTLLNCPCRAMLPGYGQTAKRRCGDCYGPGLPHSCHLCTLSFATHRRLCVHLSKHHGICAKGRAVAHGTACEMCGVQLWSTQRLAAHLARSDVCHCVYAGSDIDPDAYNGSSEPAWRPGVKVQGPWWPSMSVKNSMFYIHPRLPEPSSPRVRHWRSPHFKSWSLEGL